MEILLGFVLLAALVGILKPYINGLTRIHFSIAAIVTITLISVTEPSTNRISSTPQSAHETESASAENASARENSPEKQASKWHYKEDKDAMRGSVARFAMITSDNQINFDFPYGESGATLILRKRPEDGFNIMFTVDKGQILCHDFDDSFVSVKFDDGPVKRFSCTSASDGTSDIAFIKNEGQFLKLLKAAKKIIIEAEFYQQGRQQFTFETRDLAWK